MLFPTTDPSRTTRHCRSGRLTYAVLATILVAAPLHAQWRLDAELGDAWSLPTSVTFDQAGLPAISQTGDWSTRPFKPTYYYTGDVSHWSGNRGWAFVYTHHKIYLDNPVAGVQYFRITNGVNFFVPERVWRWRGLEYGLGAGPVMVVPVSSVRGLVYNKAHGIFGSQYEFGGGVLQATLQHRFHVFWFLSGVASLKGTASYLRVHISNGHAQTVNLALHAGYGLSIGKQ
jgi:hypothetical protein